VPLQTGQHGGYVRIVDAKTFPSAFSRPISYVMETVVVEKEGSLSRTDRNTYDGPRDDQHDKVKVQEQKTTITEERLHPEEALFLHMRGLLRIRPKQRKDPIEEDISRSAAADSTLSTQDLFNILPTCRIPLAAYLAYAHLRSQGYILMRYTDQRMRLLCRRKQFGRLIKDDSDSNTILQKIGGCGVRSMSNETAGSFGSTTSQNGGKVESDANNLPIKICPFRSQLSDDVAKAPPPGVTTLEIDGNTGKSKICLSYYAYNPNARFKRSNPGIPDFGVAVMPYRSDNGNGPTFDILNYLVSMCEEEECPDLKKDLNKSGGSLNGIPLRVITVADGGAVIAFGVTKGDVPCI